MALRTSRGQRPICRADFQRPAFRTLLHITLDIQLKLISTRKAKTVAHVAEKAFRSCARASRSL